MSGLLCPALHYGGLTLDIRSRALRMRRRFIRLRNKEFSLLEYLMRNIGKVVSRTEILEEVWDRNICCSTNTVDVHVSMLRRKLRQHSSVEFIKTIHCVGYMFSDDP